MDYFFIYILYDNYIIIFIIKLLHISSIIIIQKYIGQIEYNTININIIS